MNFSMEKDCATFSDTIKCTSTRKIFAITTITMITITVQLMIYIGIECNMNEITRIIGYELCYSLLHKPQLKFHQLKNKFQINCRKCPYIALKTHQMKLFKKIPLMHQKLNLNRLNFSFSDKHVATTRNIGIAEYGLRQYR